MLTSWARCMASRTTSSDSWWAPASTIMMPSLVPATTRSSLLLSICSYVGFTTNSPSMYPIRVALMGPWKGISEMLSAADAPIIDGISRGFSRSVERGVTIIWTSFRYPLGKRGLRDRSVNLSARMASVDGRPSLRKKLPGILPLAYSRSSKSIVRGRKSAPSLGPAMTAVTSAMESA